MPTNAEQRHLDDLIAAPFLAQGAATLRRIESAGREGNGRDPASAQPDRRAQSTATPTRTRQRPA